MELSSAAEEHWSDGALDVWFFLYQIFAACCANTRLVGQDYEFLL